MAAWAACVAGAMDAKEYVLKLTAAGFQNAEVEVYRSFTADGAEEGGSRRSGAGPGLRGQRLHSGHEVTAGAAQLLLGGRPVTAQVGAR